MAAVAVLVASSARAQAPTGPAPAAELASDRHPASLTITTAPSIDCGVTSAFGPPRSCTHVTVEGFGATPTRQAPGVLSFGDAIKRGLEHHLTILTLTHSIGEARGGQGVARSRLLPHLATEFSALEQRLNLAAQGVQLDIPVPGFEVDPAVGPFSVLDWRARLSQTVFDTAARQNHRAAGEAVRATELSVEDARDLVTLVVGRAYLETLAARSRVEAARAHVETAAAIHERSIQQQAAGLATPLDVNRAQVQTLMARQRLTGLEAAFAKQKIDLARLTGLPPTDQYELDRSVPFSAGPSMTVEEAIREAVDGRPDLQAVDAQLRAAELALAAARAERLPSVALVADVGANRAAGRPVVNTYLVAGVIRLPIWEGGRVDAQVEQARSTLRRRSAERDDLRAQIEADIRKAYVDLRATESQVSVAEQNRQVTQETLGLTRQRFDAGVSDNVTVVQAQEASATVELEYINSVLVHNLAKLELARSLGRVAENLGRFIQLSQENR